MSTDPDLMKAVRAVFGRKPRLARESLLEDKFVDLFSGAGMSVKRQVPCRFGRADVVIGNIIFELKDKLTRRSLQQALGQLMFYKYDFPSARMAIVCNSSSVPHLHDAARQAGAEVYAWLDIKRNPQCIICDPPFHRNVKLESR